MGCGTSTPSAPVTSDEPPQRQQPAVLAVSSPSSTPAQEFVPESQQQLASMQPAAPLTTSAASHSGGGRLPTSTAEAPHAAKDSAASSYHEPLQSPMLAATQRASPNGDRSKAEPGVAVPPAEVVFVLGGPGSGKSTQCELLAEHCGCRHFSPGDLLREEVHKETSLGTMISNMIRAGQIVPTQVTLDLIMAAMREGSGPCLIDGFPRSVDSLETFEEQCGRCVATLILELPQEIATERLLERGKTSGRTDDNAAAISRRFQTFQIQSLPVLNALNQQGTVHRIDASLAKDGVLAAARVVYEQYFRKSRA